MLNLNQNAKFISFEGVEGCGKSTQSKMLYEYLLSSNINTILTREIGGTIIAEEIRKIVLHDADLLPVSELMLVMAARYDHIKKLILPTLQAGDWVICDRFIDSTACYQGVYDEIGTERVLQLHRDLCGNIMPNITIFIDIPPIESLKRTIGRAGNNKFEDKDLAFHNKVYDRFQDIAKQFANRIYKINGVGLTALELHNTIVSHIQLL
jgi:dTMP kinase